MRLILIIPTMVLTASVAALALAYATSTSLPAGAAPAETQPRSGMEMLSAFKCHRSETKTILIRGMEDGFSPAGIEPGFRRPDRRTTRTASITREVGYDDSQPDGEFTDSFKVPGEIADGLFVISLKRLQSDRTDTISIGNLMPMEAGGWGGNYFSAGLSKVAALSGWKQLGSLHFARLSDVRFARPLHRPGGSSRPYSSLLDYLGQDQLDRWVDVAVQDDTAVDFMGLALCRAPGRNKGLTLAAAAGPATEIPGVLSMSCFFVDERTHRCGLYSGDMPCSTPLPVACLRPGIEPPPQQTKGTLAFRTWTGGHLKLSPAVAGSQFARIGDVDRYCARSFGPEWRTAALHDSLKIDGLAGRGDQRTVTGRVWVDIADQPYATCWRRG